MLVTRHGPGHVICIQQWRNRVFNRSFYQKKTTIYSSTPNFNWQEEIQLICWPEELDDKWSQKSAIFGSASHMTSQISTQLPASRSPSMTGSADEK